MRRLIEKKDAKGATRGLPATFSLIDRAAKWGIIKKNTAARYKSRITARLKAFQLLKRRSLHLLALTSQAEHQLFHDHAIVGTRIP